MLSPATEAKIAALPLRRAMFVREYLLDLNAAAAAVRAGFSAKTAASQGSRLLSDVKVVTAINAALADRADKLDLSAESVLPEVARLAFIDATAILHDDGSLKSLSEISAAGKAALVAVETSVQGGGEDGDDDGQFRWFQDDA
ncbi:terminase small subunit [Xanthobacteraceae bacterium A53D]